MEHHYRITVEGSLDPGWSQWLNGMRVTEVVCSDAQTLTTINGEITDQAQLRGIITKLWDLNLILISVELLNVERDKEEI